MHVVSPERSTGQKPSKYQSGSKDTSKAAALDDTLVIIVGRIPSIFSLIETILLIKNLMKSSLLRVKGIHGSTELGLFVSQATVLKRNFGLFLFSSINDE